VASAITLVELVRNGTLSADMAAVLWSAVDEEVSFVTAAVPQLAGTSTLSHAILDMRRPDIPLSEVAGEPELMARLQQEQRGGYLVVGEFSRAPVPGYIWGEPVRRVFSTLSAGYALQTTLHAPSIDATVEQISRANGVPDEDASRVKLILYVERFGAHLNDFWRRLVEVYELHKVEDGRPIGHPLFRWQADSDSFEQLSEPHQFARDRDDVARRSALIASLAAAGRTSTTEVAEAIEAFRAGVDAAL
jgi:type IV secretory pathway ATPase VirB11/archaellum biosynthesis ATPase